MKIQTVPTLLLRRLPDRQESRECGNPPEPRSVCLRANEVLRLEKPSRTQSLAVRSGTIWLTGTPAQGDVLLQAGDRFHLTTGWPFVLQALGDAEMVLLQA